MTTSGRMWRRPSASALRGILVLSGKTSRADAERAIDRHRRPTRARTAGAPDGIAATLADVVAALD